MRKTLTLLAVIVLVVAIGFGIGQWLMNPQPGPDNGPGPDGGAGLLSEQPEWCPAIELIAVPATGESRVDDDPTNPTASPIALLLSVTRAMQTDYSTEDVKVWTTPYPAEIQSIQAPHLKTYDESQAIGRDAIKAEMSATHADCPLTDYVLIGYSQGASIAGDIASEVGNGNGPVPAERVAGVALVGDPRRSPDQGMNPGVELGGVGIEVALAPMNMLVQNVTPGATMRGPRPGFGALNDRVQNICAPGDSFCDVPPAIPDAIARAGEMMAMAGAHTSYGFSQTIIPGTTPVAWIDGWVRGLIDASMARQ
ncbi:MULTISPECIES: cutinase family protein [unclassified Corynebacterium]|uniref:cutinase family protein n=1 Tax=unclassified Corynebacterium TaxID=2624378 RepID=UPI0030B6D60F